MKQWYWSTETTVTHQECGWKHIRSVFWGTNDDTTDTVLGDTRRDLFLFGNRIVWHQLANGESYSGISTVSPVTEHGITINISESSEPSEMGVSWAKSGWCRLVNQSVEKGHLGTKNQLEHRNSCWIFSEFLHFSWRFFLQGGTHTPGCCDSTKNRPKQTTSFVIFQCLLRRLTEMCTSPSSASDRKWPTLGEWGDVFCTESTAQNLASPYAEETRDLMFLDLIYSVALYLLKTIEAVNISPWSAVLFSKRRPFWDSCYHHSSDVAVTSVVAYSELWLV